MATKLQIGDEVFVPRNRLEMDGSDTSAFFRTNVVEVSKCSVCVDMRGNGQPKKIASSAVHLDLGVCLSNVGDFTTETHVLNPLAESVRQYCNLLLKPFSNFEARNIRSVAELSEFWKSDHAAASHVILSGHGSEEGILFRVDSDIAGDRLADIFSISGATPKHFLSLCCETGRQGFAKLFSCSGICKSFIGPCRAVRCGSLAICPELLWQPFPYRKHHKSCLQSGKRQSSVRRQVQALAWWKNV